MILILFVLQSENIYIAPETQTYLKLCEGSKLSWLNFRSACSRIPWSSIGIDLPLQRHGVYLACSALLFVIHVHIFTAQSS